MRSPRLALLLLAAGTPLISQERPRVTTVGWRHLFEPGPADPGIGVIAFAWPNPPSGADSLALYRAPSDPTAAGSFLFAPDGQGGWNYALAWPESLTTNLLEFGYEIVGLPFDSITPGGRWARVIPGSAVGGTRTYAWAPLVGDSLVIVRWATHLATNDLFFRDGVTPAFFDAPAGKPVMFPLPQESRDYILHPLEARGDWLRVRAVTPSDYCADPTAPRRAELWIRYLDATGRPLVWYSTRGC